MEGAALRQRQQLDIALFTSWHTARFALNGFNDKGRLAGNKTLADLMLSNGESPMPQDSENFQNAKVIHFFNTLKAKGVPIEVTRVPRNEIN